MNRHLWHLLHSCALLSLMTMGHAAVFSGSCPAPATAGFTGCYYNNTSLSGNPVFVRTDPQIDFYWGNGSPDNSLPPLNFSARWQGNFTFNQGNYAFTIVASDGIRLYVDGNLIIDRWRDQAPSMYTGSQTLSQGIHLIVVEYYEHTGGATAQVSWQNIVPVPQTPVISSFTATPSSTTSGQPVTLSFSVSGAMAVSIDNGLGNVTNSTTAAVSPAQTTTYRLTASNSVGISTATATVTVSSPDSQPPTSPTLVSTIAASATEVDLVWTASTDNVGVAGYQILRNGSFVSSISSPTLRFADTTVNSNSTYIYTVKAFDAAGNYSAASNGMQITTPSNAPVAPAQPSCSVTKQPGKLPVFTILCNAPSGSNSTVNFKSDGTQTSFFYGIDGLGCIAYVNGGAVPFTVPLPSPLNMPSTSASFVCASPSGKPAQSSVAWP